MSMICRIFDRPDIENSDPIRKMACSGPTKGVMMMMTSLMTAFYAVHVQILSNPEMFIVFQMMVLQNMFLNPFFFYRYFNLVLTILVHQDHIKLNTS